MDENKPETTDSSAEQALINPDNSREELVAERVAEAIAAAKPAEEAPAEEVSKTDEGQKTDVDSGKDTPPATEAAPSQDDALKLAEAISGRTFSSIEDYQKWLGNLNSLVGDQTIAETRKTAEQYDSLVQKFAAQSGKSVEEAKQYFADELISSLQPKPEPTEKKEDNKELDSVKDQINNLKSELQKEQLLGKYPLASQVQEEVAILAAQKDVSQIEAFENSPFKQLLEDKAKEESSKSPVVTSKSRIGVDPGKVKDKIAAVVARGNEEDKMALVEQFGDRVGL